MKIKQAHRKTLLASVAFGALSMTGAAWAQEDETSAEDEVIEVIEEDEDEARQEKVVVTGSRIARDEFTSASPVQIITGEAISEAGLLDLGEALRTTSVVQGFQLDQQFNATQVSDAGPGAQSVALRGLDPDRTLVLANGRRLAPAGIEGAPSTPDISLIPTSMIERVDILLDGASSVYGSDAIAGVVNVILIDEFDGIEIGGQMNHTLEEGGESFQVNFVSGATSDRGKFVVAGEYFHQEPQSACSRDWMETVARDNFPDFEGQTLCGSIDIDETGSFLGTGFQSQSFSAFPFGAILLGRNGQSVAGIPNFISADLANNFNGLYTLTVPLNEDLQLTPSFDRATLYATAEFDIDAVPGMTAFGEFSLSNRQAAFSSRPGVIDVVVQPDNPFLVSEGFLLGGSPPNANFTMRPLDPTRNGVESELTQYRGIAGVKGDLGFMNESAADWTYEAFLGYTRSQGYSSRGVILEENLIRSLNTVVDPETGAIVCADTPNPTGPFSPGESLEPCIPFNPFFGGLYPTDGSQPFFQDPRLEDYLSGSRSSTTFVDEIIAGGFVTGPLFDIPTGGEVSGLIGVEWRENSIDTRSDDVTARGLGSGFFVDRPSNGNVDLFEVFGEVVVPLIEDKPFADSLQVELAGRLTEHEFYGSNSTYAAKVEYDPTEWLKLRGTYGTSFRAPNLRELFLQGQSSFASVSDPCEVPTLAQSDTDGDGVLDAYTPGPIDPDTGRPQFDGRAQQVLNNCIAEGLDPFSLAIGINTGSVETFNAGNTGLDPETSTSFSYGFVAEQPFTDLFDLTLGVTWWDIEIEDSVFQPNGQFLVSQCYTSPTFPNDPFCTRRQRDPATGFLNEIDATPFNIAQQTASGIDFNLRYEQEFTAFGQDLAFSINTQATKTDDISETITLPGAAPVFDQDAGDFGNPEWRWSSQQRLDVGDNLSFFWQARMIGEQSLPDIVDETSDFDGRPDNCELGPLDDGTIPPGGEPFGTASVEVPGCYSVENTFYHDLSMNYEADTWSFRLGVQNVLDQEPPRIDEDAGTLDDPVFIDLRNVPQGVGYDRRGRTVFVAVSKKF